MNLGNSIHTSDEKRESKVDNPDNIDLVDATTVNDSQNHEVKAEVSMQRTSLLMKAKSVGNTQQHFSVGEDRQAST